MGGVPPTPAKNLLILDPPRFSLHQIFIPPPTKSKFTPTKQHFSSYNPIKIAFLAVVIAAAPFLF